MWAGPPHAPCLVAQSCSFPLPAATSRGNGPLPSSHLTTAAPAHRPCCSKSDDFYTFGSIFLEKGFEREVRTPAATPHRGTGSPGLGWGGRRRSWGSLHSQDRLGRGPENPQLLPGGGGGGASAAPAWRSLLSASFHDPNAPSEICLHGSSRLLLRPVQSLSRSWHGCLRLTALALQ